MIISLAMFICSIAKSPGITLLDTGAIRNYISLSYAKRSQIPIKRVPPKTIRTPGGLLRLHGNAEFVLGIAEWRDKVEAIVLDLEGAGFDIVLGMEWFQERNPQADWRDLEFSIETNTGTNPIHSLLTIRRLQDFDIDNSEIQAEFNLRGYEELGKYLRKESTSKKNEDPSSNGSLLLSTIESRGTAQCDRTVRRVRLSHR